MSDSFDSFANKIINKVQLDIQYRAEVRTAVIVAANGDGTFHCTLQGQNIPMMNVPAPPNVSFAVGDVVTLGFSNQDKNRPEILSWRTEQPSTQPPVFDLNPRLGNVFDMTPYHALSSNNGISVSTGNTVKLPAASMALTGGGISEIFISINGANIYTYSQTLSKLYQYTMNVNTAGNAYVLTNNWSVSLSSFGGVLGVNGTDLYVAQASGSTVNVVRISASTGAIVWTANIPNMAPYGVAPEYPRASIVGNIMVLAQPGLTSAVTANQAAVQLANGSVTTSSYTSSAHSTTYPNGSLAGFYVNTTGLFSFFVWVDDANGTTFWGSPQYPRNWGDLHVTAIMATTTGIITMDSIIVPLNAPVIGSSYWIGPSLFDNYGSGLTSYSDENENSYGLFLLQGTMAAATTTGSPYYVYTIGFGFTGNSFKQLYIDDDGATLNTLILPPAPAFAYESLDELIVGKSLVISPGPTTVAYGLNGLVEQWSIETSGVTFGDWCSQNYTALRGYPGLATTIVNNTDGTTAQAVTSPTWNNPLSFTTQPLTYMTTTGLVIAGTPLSALIYGLVITT